MDVRRLSERDVRERIEAGVGQRTDFKLSLGHPDELASDLVCFANAEGGELVIGVDDRTRRIVGVEAAQQLEDQVQSIARNNVDPPLRGVATEAVATTDGTVVVVHVPRSPDRLHVVAARGVGKIRRGTSCQPLTQSDWRSAEQSRGATFPVPDERPVAGTGSEDLDAGRLDEVFSADASYRQGDHDAVLRSLRLLGPEGATIAALLCYGRAAQRSLPQALVVAVTHSGTDVEATLEDRRELGGRLDEQLRAAVEYAIDHLPAPRDFGSSGSEERGLPVEALRHALVNALVHRDYDLNSSIRLHVFADRVEVKSPGRLLNSITVEAMRWGVHLTRNPRIYSEMVRMGLATRTGLGVRRMREVMRERGLPEPELAVAGAELHVTLRLRPPGAGALLITEPAYLSLEPKLRGRFSYYGMRADDRYPGFVAPRGRSRADAKHAAELVPLAEDPYPRRQALLETYREPSFSLVRFIGVRQFERLGGVELLDVYQPCRLRPWRRVDGALALDPLLETAAADRTPVLGDVQSSLEDLMRGAVGGRGLPLAAGAAAADFASVFRGARRLMVVGESGAGKTTLLRYVALVAAAGRRELRSRLDVDEALLPLHVSVGRFAALAAEAGPESATHLLADYFEGLDCAGAELVVRAALEDGSALLLFDGLDEVPDATERRQVERLIEQLSARHPRCRVLVTSRIVGYAPLAISGAEEWKLEPLDEDAARKLATAFYTAHYRVDLGGDDERARRQATAEASALLGALTSRPALRPFLENPLLLTLSALVHTQLGRLPRYRALLYKVATQTLLETWTSARLAVPPLKPPRPIDYEIEGVTIFPELALDLHTHHDDGLILEEDLIAFLCQRLAGASRLDEAERRAGALDLLRRVAAGGSILIERGRGRWGFLHRSVQEYLAAKALAADGELRASYLRDRLYDPAFEEIWRLVGGEIGVSQERPREASRYVRAILDDRDELYAGFFRRNVVLAAKCLADTVVTDDDLVERLIGEVVALVVGERVVPPETVVDGLLGELVPLPERDRLAEALASSLASEGASARAAAGRALGRLEAERQVAALVGVLRDPKPAPRREAAAALGKLGKTMTVAPLLALLESETDPEVLSCAAVAVSPGLGWSADAHGKIARRAPAFLIGVGLARGV